MSRPASIATPRRVEQELVLLRTAHPNALVVGDESVVGLVLSSLRDDCRQPVAVAVATNPLALPSRSFCGTLILHDVLCLSLDGQRQLLAWLDDAHDSTQLVATAARPPWPYIGAGTFLSALYYRLNIVYVDLT